MTLLAGRYETVRPIAAGGMATVYLAKAVGLGGFERLVAVKVMHPHLSLDPDFVAMFLDEARLAAGIRHPNVVATMDVQQSSDGLFLVMEYIEGCSLRGLLRGLWRKKKQLPVDVVLKIFGEALAGLHAAHELRDATGKPLRLVHRDVSPANILVGADGVTRLTDFGVARAESRISSTRGGQLKGKIPYMPPEQIMGEEVDRRVDVYATGLVLWEALVGKRAFRAPNEGALLHQILGGASESPRQLRQDVPSSVDRVCMGALALKPDERYASAAEFAEALEQAAAQANVRVATARAVSALVTEITSDMGDAPVGEGSSAPIPDWSGKWDGEETDGAPSSADGGTEDDEATAASAEAGNGALTDGVPSSAHSTSVAGALATEAERQLSPPRTRTPRVAIVAGIAIAVGLAAGIGYRMQGNGGEPSVPGAADGSPSSPSGEPTAAPTDGVPTAHGSSEPVPAATPVAVTSATGAAPASTNSSTAPASAGAASRPPSTPPKKGTRKRPPTAATSPTGYRPTQL